MRRGLIILFLVAACGSATTQETSTTGVETTTSTAATEASSTTRGTKPRADRSSQSTTSTVGRSAGSSTTTTTGQAGGGEIGSADGFHSNIAVVGCSQTRDAIFGYNALASDERFGSDRSAGYLSGGSIELWAEDFNRKWDMFGQLAGPDNDALWIMICWHFQRSVGADVAMVEKVIDQAFDAIGGSVPVYISGLNDWDPRDICPRGDFPASARLADDVVAAGLALRGPDLGPITRDQTADGCHGNDEGNAVMGAQLIEFFG